MLCVADNQQLTRTLAEAQAPGGRETPSLLLTLWRPFQGSLRTSVELVDELIHHRFFQSLRQVDWSDYRLGPILIASVLINLLELSSPLYINIINISILPSGFIASLVVLTIAVVLLMVLGGWL